ncbi:MAG TPA: outer membrane beta-barrel protein [Tepidisphaeraceae bacterium]|jgi:hypothetical protein
MSLRHVLMGLAGGVLLAGAATGACASEDEGLAAPPPAPGTQTGIDPGALSLTAPAEVLRLQAAGRDPLMALLDKMGWAKALDDAGITLFGAIQASYTYNLSNPHQDHPPDPTDRIQLRMFDHHHARAAINRIDLYAQRPVDYHAGKWDVGGLAEVQYGIDAAMMHSNGLFDYDYYHNHAEPEYQFDVTQAFVDLAVPVGRGLRIRAGKFATILGYESCDPIHTQAVQFYSRSFILSFGIPMYQTGAYATYDVNDNLTINAGITRGWEQSLSDNNAAIDFLGSVNWVINDRFTAYFGASVGPQLPDDSSHYRTLLEGILFFTPDPRGPWSFALDGIVGFEDNEIGPNSSTSSGYLEQHVSGSSADLTPNDRTPVGETFWAGIAGFGGYRVSENFKLKGRAEWFHDEDGSRFRVPTENAVFTAGVMNDPWVTLGRPYNVFEFTFGADWHPFPHDARTLLVRPEVRVDYADRQIFANGNDNFQVTLAVDAIFRF